MSATPGRAPDHLAPLDGLRGIAIALVVWFHVWQISWLAADVHLPFGVVNFNWIPEDGFVGVDLFFFISGFCLFYPYAQTLFDGRARQGVGTFAYRRAIKIVPSYVLAIAGTIALGWATFGSPADELRQVVLHLLFIHTLFSDSYGSINGVLWSLATEVQFYVVFPLVCWAAMRRPWWTFAALAVAANAYRIAVAGHADVVHQIDQLPGTIDLFGAGMLAAYLFRSIGTRAPRLAGRRVLWTAVAVAGFVAFYAILRSAFAARLFDDWPMTWYLVGRPAMTLAFTAMTLGSLFAFRAWQRVLANPLLAFLSAISYNLYLWHQPIARALLGARIPAYAGADQHRDAAWAVPYTFVAFAAAIAVATAITFAFERPLMRRRRFEPRREPSLHVSVDRRGQGASVREGSGV